MGFVCWQNGQAEKYIKQPGIFEVVGKPDAA